MKTKSFNTMTKNMIFSALAAILIFSLGSCAKKISFLTSSVVPAAEGTVKIKKDNNNNYAIQLDMVNLAEPGRLQPAKNAYVVWMETEANMVKNIGQINTSSGFLSKKLKASFKTVSSQKPSKIFITAEDDAAVQYPGMMVVLTTNSF
jgi:hypothetical protein